MKKSFIIIAVIATAFFLSSCHNHSEGDGHDHGSESGHDEHDHGSHENASTATLTAEQLKSIKVELGGIEKKQLTASLRANGILKVPNQNKANATAMLGGVVKTILVQPGNTVSKGQTVATIANTAFIVMQEEFLSVSSKAALAELEFARQKELQAGNAGALKNLQSSEAELKTLKARKSSLQKQLEMVGVNPSALDSENIQAEVSIKSPVSGSVSDVMVNIGSFVDANNPVAEIIDNSQLHVDLFVYEKDLPKLKKGQIIHFTLTNNPGKEYDAKIYGISNTFEPNTKAVAVHASVEGDKTGLIDGMSISALVSLENATVDAVPTDAIISSEGQDYILVVTDEHSEEEHHAEGDGHNHDEHGHQHDEKEAEHKEGDGHNHAGEKHEHVEGEEHHATEEKSAADGSMTFERIPVRKGTTDVGYSEITLLREIPANAKIATVGAFFIMAKMTNQGEGHAH